MFYAGVTVLNLIACCYLLFRRANAITPDITPPLRLRRCTAALLGSITLSYVWCASVFYLTSAEAIKMVYFVGALLDFLARQVPVPAVLSKVICVICEICVTFNQ